MEWFKTQWKATKRYFDLTDNQQQWPPMLVFIGSFLILLGIMVAFANN